MCVTGLPGTPHVPARDYFSEAKRRSAHLQPLKSVSRAYRRSEVRQIKLRAVAQKEKDDVSRRAQEEAARRAAEASNTGGYGGTPPGGITFVTPGQLALARQNAYPYHNAVNAVGTTRGGGGGGGGHYFGPRLAGNNVYTVPYAVAFTPTEPAKPLPVEIKAGELVAWRVWRRHNGKLLSTYMPTEWEMGKTIEGKPSDGSGVHAWKDEAFARAYMGEFNCDLTLGTVELWGEVIEHDEGYRAQFGAIKEIVEEVSAPGALSYYVTQASGPDAFTLDHDAYKSADAFVIVVGVAFLVGVMWLTLKWIGAL